MNSLLSIIQERNYRRINVCGSPGAGKSTVALALARACEVPYFDLDDLLYDSSCRAKSMEERCASQNAVLQLPAFVLDGTYRSLFVGRLHALDCVVLVDTPTVVCAWRFARRLFTASHLKCGERLTAKTATLVTTFGRSKGWLLESARQAGVATIVHRAGGIDVSAP